MPRTKYNSKGVSSSDFFHKEQDEACLSEQELSDKHELCEYHDGKIIEMYCQQHDAVCCRVCVSEEHRFCSRVDRISKIARRLLQEDSGMKYDLLEVSRDLRELKSKQMAFREDMNDKQTQITLEIQQFKTQLVKRAEDLERASISEVEKRCKSITALLDQDIKRVDKMLLDVERDLSKLKEETHGNEVTVFANRKLAKQHMSTRIDCRTELFGKPYENFDFSIHADMKSYFKNYESLGTLTKTRRPLTPFVNILIPNPSRATDSLKDTLEVDLKQYGVRSKFINILTFESDVHTIVVITSTDDIHHLRIERQQHRHIIILRLEDTPPGGRSWIDKINDYMVVPSGKDVFNFLNWADVALKATISFTSSLFQYQFSRSDKASVLRQIAEIVQK